MTFEDFKKLTQRRNSFDKFWHYGLAIIVGIFSLFGIFYVAFVDTGKFRAVEYLIYPGLLIFLTMSLSAAWLLPNRYKIVEIASSLDYEDKRRLVSSFILEYCQTSAVPKTNHFVFILKRRWWQSIYKLHFYYDDSRFAFTLQGHDHNGGWIDFGETERKRRKLQTAIIKLMTP